MKKILVCGLSNMETVCAVGGFPLEYCPVDYNFFGIQSSPSGVGLNVSLALSKLGDAVTLLSYAGEDPAGDSLRTAAGEIACPVLLPCRQTSQSVVLYDPSGRRRIETDLKDMQELSVARDVFDAYKDVDAFCLCNINFARPLLEFAKESGKPIFTDVHCLSDIFDEYNRDFIRAADVLFLSNENIRGREEAFVRELAAAYDNDVIVVGMGERGAMLFTRCDGQVTVVPAVSVGEVVNTVGAGDSLFSAFVHFYTAGESALNALRLATVFASYKIGFSGASKGFLSESELLRLTEDVL